MWAFISHYKGGVARVLNEAPNDLRCRCLSGMTQYPLTQLSQLVLLANDEASNTNATQRSPLELLDCFSLLALSQRNGRNWRLKLSKTLAVPRRKSDKNRKTVAEQ